MKLIITEKPSVAMSIAKVLGIHGRKYGYVESKEYIISWCVGHLVGLAQADKYNEKYKKWRYEDLPIIPSEFQYDLFVKTKKQYEILNKLLNRSDVLEVINACDLGREGELIFRLVYYHSKCQKPMKRLWISSMEDSAIKDGFKNLKDGKEFYNLYKSALARSQADWIVGINATRLFTVLYNQLLSVGRVQTPTLALIVNREEDIRSFRKEKFYHLDLYLDGFMASSDRIKEKDEANELKNLCIGEMAIAKDVTKQKKNVNPPLPFDLTSLQREANRLFGYTAKQTLDYTQSLYEKKWVTYPRTDSRCLTDDMMESLINLINGIDKDNLVENPNYKRILDSKKVTDHHAIIPTIQSLNMNIEDIPKTEKNIYNLICLKLLEAVADTYEEEIVTVSLLVGDKIFTAKGKKVVNLGFKGIKSNFDENFNTMEKEKDNSILLPEIEEGMVFEIQNSEIREGLTQPPKHFTEDTLLSAMERAGNEELDKELDVEKKGLGTPATRAGIIEKLISVGYLERKKKQLLPTDKGVSLITVMPDNLKSPKLTAEWENKLTEISLGKGSDEEFLKGIDEMITDLVKTYSHIAVENKEKFQSNREVLGSCPRCKSYIFEGKKNFYCSNKECGFSLFKEDRFFTDKRKKLTKEMVKILLSKGEVTVKGLYSKKTGRTYNAYISIEDTGKYINYKMRF